MNGKQRLTVSSASCTVDPPVAGGLISIKLFCLRLTREKTSSTAPKQDRISRFPGCLAAISLSPLTACVSAHINLYEYICGSIIFFPDMTCLINSLYLVQKINKS